MQQNENLWSDSTKEKFMPKVSIIIVNYNGFYYLDRCIKSILVNTYTNYEIIVVDNGSTDNSLDKLRMKFGARVRVVALDRNYGPAKARNRGVSIAEGKYIGFLDNDTTVHQDWAIEAIRKFEENNRIGVIQCKLLLLRDPNRIDYVGEFLGQNGFLVQVAPANEVDSGQFEKDYEILAAKSAGMFVRKEVFDRIGGFDDDYFMYVEETDLGWRSWLAGYKAVFAHKSVVYHEFGTSSIILAKNTLDYNVRFHGTKNYILTLYKNLGTREMLRILPQHIFMWIGLSFYSLTRKDLRGFFYVHKALLWNIENLPRSFVKRKHIQRSRVIQDSELLKIVMKTRELSYFLTKVTVKSTVGYGESAWAN